MRTSLICRIIFAFAIMLAAMAFLFSSISSAIVSITFTFLYVYAFKRFEYELRTSKIELNRTAQQEMAHANEPFQVSLKIINSGQVTVRGAFEDKLPPDCTLAAGTNKVNAVLPPSSVVNLSYSILPAKRGTHSFPGLAISRDDVTGLFVEDEVLEDPFSITVHTQRDSFDAARRIIGREHLELSGAARRPAVILRELEFEGVREYVAGDRARDIMWKAFPRFDTLLTKVYKKEGALQTTIVVDCSRSMRLQRLELSKIDHAVDLSMQLANLLLGGLHPAGLLTFDEARVLDGVSPALGHHQFQKILQVLKNAPSSFKGKEEQEVSVQPQTLNEAEKRTEDTSSKKSEDVDFFSALSSLKGRGGRIDLGLGLEGAINETIGRARGQEQLFIVISDLVSSRDSVLTGAKICQRTGNRMIVIQTYDDWYNSTDGTLDSQNLEGFYAALSDSLKVEAMLRAGGASYMRIGPADSAAGIARAIRRGKV